METGVTLYVKFWDKMYHCILNSGPRFPQECRRRQGNFWAQQRTWGQVTSSGVFPDHKRSRGFSLLVSQSHLTLCDSMDCSPPGSSCLWDSPGRNTGVACHSVLHGICPIQGSKLGLLHCRQSLYCLSHQGRFNFSVESDTPSEHSQGPDHFRDAHRESGSANSDNLNANQTSHTASCAGTTPP